jgi:hypothetical protein
MKKIRVNLTIDWDKSVIDATKKSEVKDGIIDEVNEIATTAFADFNPSDIKVRFLRSKK